MLHALPIFAHLYLKSPTTDETNCVGGEKRHTGQAPDRVRDVSGSSLVRDNDKPSYRRMIT
jgi:hypothetical protein